VCRTDFSLEKNNNNTRKSRRTIPNDPHHYDIWADRRQRGTDSHHLSFAFSFSETKQIDFAEGVEMPGSGTLGPQDKLMKEMRLMCVAGRPK